MGMYRRFYGFENFSAPGTVTNVMTGGYNAVTEALSWAFRNDQGNDGVHIPRPAILTLQYLNSTYSFSRSVVNGANHLLSRRESGTNASQGILRAQVQAQEKGISRIGVRMTRRYGASAPCVYLSGQFESMNGAETYTAYAWGYNTLTECYVEVEIDWVEKIVKVYLNDSLNGQLKFTNIGFIWLGSFTQPSYVRSSPNPNSGSVTASWGFNTETAPFQTWGDIYMTHWDGEGKDDGRPGPIYCIRVVGRDPKVGGSYKGSISTNQQFLGKSLMFEQYINDGILTQGVNAESTVTFDQVKPGAVDGEVLGYSFSIAASQNDATQPLYIDGKVYIGEEEYPTNGDIAATPITQAAPSAPAPYASTLFIPIDKLKEGDNMVVGAKLVRKA